MVRRKLSLVIDPFEIEARRDTLASRSSCKLYFASMLEILLGLILMTGAQDQTTAD